jgi:hypothetical protein
MLIAVFTIGPEALVVSPTAMAVIQLASPNGIKFFSKSIHRETELPHV